MNAAEGSLEERGALVDLVIAVARREAELSAGKLRPKPVSLLASHDMAFAKGAFEAVSALATVAVGTLDLFFDESIEYARRLSRSGVPVELHTYPGAIHGFDAVPTAWMSLYMKRALHDALVRAVRSGAGLAQETTA